MKQTEGQKRVRKSFNPNSLNRVEKLKELAASTIDFLNDVVTNVKIKGYDDPEIGDFMREVATAKTQIQLASMCSVGAVTHEVAFKHFQEDKELEGRAPHEVRVLVERAELDVKHKALTEFILENSFFNTLSPAEQEDLKKQEVYMGSYLDVLNKRIARFTND